ncbi:hypothetical protein BGX27_006953 [Mortierella sp. AM989]|nr:hypothetical protein BGX27_006953 [Mortierella sp. AM989]
MSTINPLELPEVLLRVAEYLEEESFIRCVSVCKAWYQILVGLLWKEVVAMDCILFSVPQGFTPHTLIQHHDLVEDLEIHNNLLAAYTITYPKLHTLKLVQSSSWDTMNNSKGDPVKLISANPSLVHLSLASFEGYPSAPFWTAVSSLPRLKTIKLRNVTMGDKANLETFWVACQNVDGLSLSRMRLTDSNLELSGTLPFQRIQALELEIDGDQMMQLSLIRQCPHLEDLTWHPRGDTTVLGLFAQDVKQGLWPKLTRLSLFHDVPDALSASIIDSIKKLDRLDMNTGGFGLLSFQALRRHSNTLVKLNLGRCTDVKSQLLNEVMCSCPHLKEFIGHHLIAQDVVDGDPWVCLSLEVLVTCFLFGHLEQDLQPLVFDRLSRLVHLKVLQIGDTTPWTTIHFQGALDLRLVSGLGALAKLKNLKHLDINNTTQRIGKEEVRWMLANWRKLETLDGLLSKGHALCKVLQKHDIRVT